MRPVLYQRARPSTLDGYVFVDRNMEIKIKEWVAKKELPNLLLTGSPGTGKCLVGTEEIRVKIPSDYIESFTRYEENDGVCVIPIGQLFYLLGLDNEFTTLEQVEELPFDVSIETEDGYAPIRGMVVKRHRASQYILANGFSLACSDAHLIYENGTLKKIGEASSVDTVWQDAVVIDRVIPFEDEMFVYDVALDAPHRYVTPNGIIHHNTSLAYILANELGIPDQDVLYVRSTLSNGIETIRDRVVPFVELVSHTPAGRMVILDECDKLSASAQDGLRNIIEDCMEHARFILTGNYAHKFTDALASRCQSFHIESLDRNGFMLRVGEILQEEGITFDIEALEHYTDKNYPDMRGIFNDVERYTFDGKLQIVESASQIQTSEWMMQAIAHIMEGQYSEGRNIICKNISYEEYGDFYRLIYENMDWWANGDQAKQDRVIMTVKEHLVADSQVGDREIVLSACLTKLAFIAK